MGKRKKFERVCASNTSFAETAISKPIKVEVRAIKKTAVNRIPQLIPPRLTKKDAKITGTKAFRQPNRTAPDILARTSMLKLTGASSSLSKERPLLSNVMVTASMEVKRMPGH